MAIKIDRESCTGCGLCESVCADVFEMDDEDKAIVKDPDSTADCLQEAIDSCPVEAISKD